MSRARRIVSSSCGTYLGFPAISASLLATMRSPFSATVVPGYQAHSRRKAHARMLASRTRLGHEQYSSWFYGDNHPAVADYSTPYVTGGKIVSGQRQAAIRRRLLEVLGEEEARPAPASAA